MCAARGIEHYPGELGARGSSCPNSGKPLIDTIEAGSVRKK